MQTSLVLCLNHYKLASRQACKQGGNSTLAIAHIYILSLSVHRCTPYWHATTWYPLVTPTKHVKGVLERKHADGIRKRRLEYIRHNVLQTRTKTVYFSVRSYTLAQRNDYQQMHRMFTDTPRQHFYLYAHTSMSFNVDYDMQIQRTY